MATNNYIPTKNICEIKSHVAKFIIYKQGTTGSDRINNLDLTMFLLKDRNLFYQLKNENKLIMR